MSDLTALAVGAITVAIAAALLRTRRRRSQARIAAILGVGLLVVSVLVALIYLGERDTPPPLRGAVGVLTPAPVLPRINRGFAVSLAVDVSGCSNPVKVRLVAEGTSEFWSDYRAAAPSDRTGAYPFAVVLPPGVVGVPRVGAGASGTEIEDPVTSRFAPMDPVRIYQIRRFAMGTVITASMRDWPATLQPLLVTFDADWLSARGMSTCYLRLPVLSGTATATVLVGALGCAEINRQYPTARNPCGPAKQAAGEPFLGALVISDGISVTTVASGAVSPDLSTPVPPTDVNGNYAWTCQPPPGAASAGSASNPGPYSGMRGLDNGAAFSLQAIEDTTGGSCAAVAVITENSAAYSRDLLILLIGAVMGLGLTLIVQAIIDRFGSPSKAPEHDGPTRAHPDSADAIAQSDVTPSAMRRRSPGS